MISAHLVKGEGNTTDNASKILIFCEKICKGKRISEHYNTSFLNYLILFHAVSTDL